MPHYTNTNIAKIVKESTDDMIKIFTNNLNSKKTITHFSHINSAINPIVVENFINFRNTIQVSNIFKSLPNKSSSGPYNIPPIIFKHLYPLLIRDYTIIFYNCLNNLFYPEAWKTAKLLPLLK